MNRFCWFFHHRYSKIDLNNGIEALKSGDRILMDSLLLANYKDFDASSPSLYRFQMAHAHYRAEGHGDGAGDEYMEVEILEEYYGFGHIVDVFGKNTKKILFEPDLMPGQEY